MKNPRRERDRIILSDRLHMFRHTGLLKLILAHDINPTLHQSRYRRRVLAVLADAPIKPDRRSVAIAPGIGFPARRGSSGHPGLSQGPFQRAFDSVIRVGV